MVLLDEDWTDAQVQGLLDALELVETIPRWKPEHLQRLYEAIFSGVGLCLASP